MRRYLWDAQGTATHLRQYRGWQNTAHLLLPQNTKPPSPARVPSSRSRSGVASNYPESTRLQSPRAGVPQAGLPTPSFPGERTGVAGSPAESTLQSHGASTALGSSLRYLIRRRVLIEEQGDTSLDEALWRVRSSCSLVEPWIYSMGSSSFLSPLSSRMLPLGLNPPVVLCHVAPASLSRTERSLVPSPPSTSVAGVGRHFGERGCHPHQHLLEEQPALQSLRAARPTENPSTVEWLGWTGPGKVSHVTCTRKV